LQTCAEARQLLDLFPFSSGKLDALAVIARTCVCALLCDIHGHHFTTPPPPNPQSQPARITDISTSQQTVVDAFSFSSDRGKASEILASAAATGVAAMGVRTTHGITAGRCE